MQNFNLSPFYFGSVFLSIIPDFLVGTWERTQEAWRMEIKETVLGGEVVNGDETVQMRRGSDHKDICVFSGKNFSSYKQLGNKMYMVILHKSKNT